MTIQHYIVVGFAYMEVKSMAGILITIKTGGGQEDPLSSILLFFLAMAPLNRLFLPLPSGT
jgi:hypothetical protein